MNIFIETLDVFKSTAFKKFCVFIVLIFLNLASDTCPAHNND